MSKRGFAVLTAVTLLPRLALALQRGVWGDPEIWEYDVIASAIHGGFGHLYDRSGFLYFAYSPPVWPYVLAALRSLPGESRASVQVLQAFFCLGTALVCAAIARRLGGGPTIEWLTALVVTLQPSLLYYSVVKSDPLPLNAFLLALIVLAGSRLVDKPGTAQAFAVGLLVALGTLARGTPAVVLPVVALLLMWRLRVKALSPLLMLTVGFAAGLAPWLIRNTLILGAPVITTTSGENFWRGNNEEATGGVYSPSGASLSSLYPENPIFPPAIRETLTHGSEIDRQNVFAAEAWRFIRENPGRALELFGIKMRRFWWRVESSPEDYSPRMARLYEWIYRSELALALLGLAALLRRGGPLAINTSRGATVALALAAMALVSVLQSAFYVQGRHRFLIEPLLLIFTAIGADTLVTALRGSHREVQAPLFRSWRRRDLLSPERGGHRGA